MPAKSKKISAEDFARVLMRAEKGSPLESLSKEGIGNPLLIVGEEELRVKRLVTYLRENFFAPDAYKALFGPEITTAGKVRELIGSLSAMSLFSNCELIALFGADNIKAATAKPLVEALAQKPAFSSLFVMTAKSAKKKSKLLEQAATVIEVQELAGNKLARWIEKEAARAGASSIEREAVSTLVQLYGNDLLNLSQELSKLALLSAEDEGITKKLVLQLSNRRPERTSFELMTQMAAGNLSQALTLTEDILRQGVHPLQLNGFLSKAYRTMLAAKNDAPADLKPLGSDLNNPWFLKKLPTGRHDLKSLQGSLEVLAALDFKLKDGNNEEVMLTSVTRLTQRAL